MNNMIKRRVGLGVWLLTVLLLAFFENNTGTRVIFLTSLLIPLFSVLCAGWTARKIQADIQVPGLCTENRATEIRISLHAPFTRVGCRIQTSVTQNNCMTGQQYNHIAESSCVRSLNTSVFGTMNVSIPAIIVEDWLGLISFSIDPKANAECTVAPLLFPVQLQISVPRDFHQDTDRVRLTGRSSDESMGVRPYRAGDPVRMMHWKLTARTDEPFVRETGSPLENKILLLLDNQDRPSILETDRLKSIRAFLSTARILCEEGHPFTACMADDSADLLQMHLITCQRELDLLTEQILRTPPTTRHESVGTLYASVHPENEASHVVLFAPEPDTDAVSLYNGRQVTLVLPDAEGSVPGSAEVVVRALNERQRELVI